jgi:hypothetical protein
MGDTALFSDQVIEFLGELYVHEPDELRTRIQFRDYLELLLRNTPRITTYHPFHAHRCACGTFLTCEAPSAEACAQQPSCRECRAGSVYRRQEKPSLNHGSIEDSPATASSLGGSAARRWVGASPFIGRSQASGALGAVHFTGR